MTSESTPVPSEAEATKQEQPPTREQVADKLLRGAFGMPEAKEQTGSPEGSAPDESTEDEPSSIPEGAFGYAAALWGGGYVPNGMEMYGPVYVDDLGDEEPDPFFDGAEHER